MKIFLMLSLGLLWIDSAFAESKTSWVCKQGSNERTVKVVYETEGKRVPCKVMYKKENGDEKQLWNAISHEDYCEEQAQGFADKLAGFGWKCE